MAEHKTIYDHRQLPVILTPKEVAELLRCTSRTVVNLCEAGKLKADKTTGKWLIPKGLILDKLGIPHDEYMGYDELVCVVARLPQKQKETLRRFLEESQTASKIQVRKGA